VGEDRRARDRFRIWAPAVVTGEGVTEGEAVTYDASDGGVRLLARFTLPLGSRVELQLDLAGVPPRRVVTRGRITRAHKNEDDPEGLWPERLGVELDEPVEGLERQLLALAAEHPFAADG
jgi:hypothetical protein